MLYLAFIYHMHQPYYTNLLTKESPSPWVRLHATKDYSDMVLILEKFPKIHQTFNLVPSLVEQVEDYISGNVKDAFEIVSRKKTGELTGEDKEFLRANFFKIDPYRVIAHMPRYYQLYMQNQENGSADFTDQDYLDLVVCFNLAWIDPYFRQNIPELKAVMEKDRFFSEEDKEVVLAKQKEIIKDTIPIYKRFSEKGQIEVSITPYYHPILPLLYNTKIAIEANPNTPLPKGLVFDYPADAKAQIFNAVDFMKQRLGRQPQGMWPSEESVSEHILPFIIQSGIKWIVTDEAVLFKSITKKRSGKVLYQPYRLKRKDGELNIVFRDRNLSDLIGFIYHRWKTEDAVNNFMMHLENIAKALKNEDCLLTIALDGENAWEYYPNDGHDFLNLLYQRISDAEFVKTVCVGEYLKSHPPKQNISKLKAGSWINGDFQKWIGNQYKNKAWECLAQARKALEKLKDPKKHDLAWKQMYILEGSDWFWWYGDKMPEFDMLFRMHLSNFYRIIGEEIPAYLNAPLEPV
ncbi:MAG: glycoside hydrolase family 57 protein [Candidatus Omnitrophica bacterium]|nr:glycoside hydrolase family 57 protein [Candidatus Omnitrophota bacterium]MDD5236607.1 glycoside hydrolase family 57 protein [Candidatus Omnitrophota bacterium]MDD5610436.1 glycoside hydrolase family 57 protein [Candidatus Omnitrophota bacterium]